MLSRTRLWLSLPLLRRWLETEMQDEVATHIERATERVTARGVSPTDARLAAIREFGKTPEHADAGLSY